MNKQRNKSLLFLIPAIVFCLAALLVTLFCLNQAKWYWQLLCYGVLLFFMAGAIYSHYAKKESIQKSCLLLSIVAWIVLTGWALFNHYGIWTRLSDVEDIRTIILNSGGWGYLIYLLLQILNVVILPLPAVVMPLVGMAVYGPLEAFLICYLGALIGSLIAFGIGRIFGKRVVVWCVGEARTEKYSEQFGTRGNILFVLMQLLPFFPDDILCMVAGLSSMSLRFFTVTMVLTRPVFLAAVCFLGSGTIIPFSGWRIPVWVAIFVAAGILFLLFCRYQEKIESWLKDKICGWRTKNKNQT